MYQRSTTNALLACTTPRIPPRPNTQTCRANARNTIPVPAATASSAITLGYTPAALAPALPLPKLVLPENCSMPLFPFDVASTASSIVAVFLIFVIAVVPNVAVLVGSDSAAASSLMNTSANPGAGTLTWQVFAAWSHWMVSIWSSFFRRLSDSNCPPKVCGCVVRWYSMRYVSTAIH